MCQVVDVLEYVTLGDITTSTQIYYDPDPRSTVVEEDVELLEGHFDIQEEEEDDKDTDRLYKYAEVRTDTRQRQHTRESTSSCPESQDFFNVISF